MSQVQADNVEGIVIRNPRTGKELYTVSEYSDEEVAEIYQTASTAYAKIRSMSIEARLRETAKLKTYIRDQKDAMCRKIVSETGKSRTDALLAEIYPVLDMLAYYAKHAKRFLAHESVSVPVALLGPGPVQTVSDFFAKKAKIVYEPMGTVLVVAPWNYPFHLSFFPALSAFLAGNSVIVKPSTQTPLKGLYEEMIEKSGFMKDAVQLVYGSRKTGKKLIDAKPAKIFFTGSVSGGRHVMKQAAEHLIPVELELGGKDPMVVFDDVNMDRATSGALWGGMLNCGQTCTSVERIFVQETILNDFVGELKRKAEKLSTFKNVDDDDGGLCMGCMTAEFQIQTLEEQLEEAKAKGAEVVTGGAREGDSHIFPPTIVITRDTSLKIMNDETFGPIVTVTPFKTEEEAIELANASAFGLNASVWSTDLARAERVALALVSGSVSINNVLATQANAGLPFGGAKESGLGRYHGAFGLHTFCNVKSMTIEPCSARQEINWYPYTPEKFAVLNKLFEILFSDSPVALLKAGLVGNKLAALVKRQRL